jgi:LysR family transcriptional regulator, transcriptional activator AphB
MLDDIVLFIHIVQQGGLAGAARHLNLPPATVTRRLQKLEHQLGCQLLHRSARQCVLTGDGEVYYQSYADLAEQFEQAQRQLSEDMTQLRGKLRVLAPSNISHGFLRPFWLHFTRAYPDIQLELHLDIALRIGPQPDSLLYQQKLGQIDKVMVASPAYLAAQGMPVQPSDIKEHRVIGTILFPRWKLSHLETGTSQEIFPRFCSLFNDTSFAKYLACDGQGIALLPITEVKRELDNGGLLRILPQWQGEPRNIYAVWPSGKLLSEKAKVLRDSLHKFIQEHLRKAQ